MVHEHVDHGRHQQGEGGAVRGDGLQDGDGLEAGNDDMGAAARGDEEGGGVVGDVEHRGGVQHAGGFGAVDLGGHVQHVGEEVAVAEHDAFGTAGGAAGVEDAGEVGAGSVCVR